MELCLAIVVLGVLALSFVPLARLALVPADMWKRYDSLSKELESPAPCLHQRPNKAFYEQNLIQPAFSAGVGRRKLDGFGVDLPCLGADVVWIDGE